jgi:hypothetical protein
MMQAQPLLFAALHGQAAIRIHEPKRTGAARR